jgi:hypothetical protein
LHVAADEEGGTPRTRDSALRAPLGLPVRYLVQDRAKPQGKVLRRLRRKPIHAGPRDGLTVRARNGHDSDVVERDKAHIPVHPARPEAAGQQVTVQIDGHGAEEADISDAALLTRLSTCARCDRLVLRLHMSTQLYLELTLPVEAQEHLGHVRAQDEAIAGQLLWGAVTVKRRNLQVAQERP